MGASIHDPYSSASYNRMADSRLDKYYHFAVNKAFFGGKRNQPADNWIFDGT